MRKREPASTRKDASHIQGINDAKIAHGESLTRPDKGKIIQEAIAALEHGVKPRTIASKYGIPYRTLAHWLQYNQDAYRARHSFIALHLAHLQGKRRDWHLRMRLERLSLYRQLHGMPPNPSPGYRKRSKDTP